MTKLTDKILMNKQGISDFLKALSEGRACLHPTDTLPGLAFDPDVSAGGDVALRFKTGHESKSFLNLVHSFDFALTLWTPLPKRWNEVLDTIWPAPLSVIWQASPSAPRSVVGDDGTIGLRVPKLSRGNSWLNTVMKELGRPLPSTSVNRHGEKPAMSWEDAKKTISGESGFYIPAVKVENSTETKPSSIVSVNNDGSFTMIREGAVKTSEIEKLLDENR